jgi:transposase InsO family protein
VLPRPVGCKISLATVGEPTGNGYAERLVRTVTEAHIALTEYAGYADAYPPLGRFLDDMSQQKRIHTAQGYVTPRELERQWHQEQEERAASAKPTLSNCPTLGDTLSVHHLT